MAAAHIFLSIAGSQFLGNMVTRATDKITRKIGPRVIRALRNYNLREARGATDIGGASIREVQSARKSAVGQFRSFRKAFERSSRTLNSFITRDLELTSKLDRAAGRIFTGPASSKIGRSFTPSFTKHMKTVIANDLATMPVTYAMYQYDKSKYPEMKDTSFMKYYMQTIPYNLGFQASSAAVRTATRIGSNRLSNKIAHSRFTPKAIESVLDIGQAAAAKIGSALAYHSTLKREMLDSTALRDFASVRGVQGIWHRLGHAHKSAASAARTPYATRVMDSDLFQRRMGEYYEQTAISQQDARRVGEEFNSMLDPDFKRSHAFGFLNKLLQPHNVRLQKEVAAPMLINRPSPTGGDQPAVITDFVRDRSRFEFVRNGIKDEKVYDFGIFNIDRLRDSVADFVEGSGFHTPFGFLKALKITTGGFDFIRSDFKRNLSNAVVGGRTRSFAVTPALAEIANNQPGISEIKETADYRKHAEGILRETFGLRSSEEAGVLLERMASSHNAKTVEQVSSTISSPFQVDLYSKRLVENAKHGSLPIEKGSFFFFNSKGYGTLITGGDTGRDYVASGLGRMTISTNENKSSVAEVMTRLLGSSRHGNEIYGLERTRKLSGHELYEQRRSMGITDEKELWGFTDTISERFDLGGGGTSVLDWIKGYYTKFKNPSYARNIFTSDVFVNEVSNLTSQTPDVSSAKWFIKTLDNVFSTSQERVSRKLFDSNSQRRRFWGTLDRQLTAFSEKVGAEFKHSEMSLNGITNITEALQRVNRYEEFASAFDSPNMVQFTGSLKKALTEKGSIKEALNTITFGDNITMFEKYESMLDHNFLIRAHRTGSPDVPASDVFFETARRLIPKSKMGDFSTYSKVISSHNKILSIRNIKGPDNTITEDYIQGLQSLGEDLDITDSTLGKRMSHLLMGKFGEFSDSVGFKRYKYVPHNTDAMFFFTDRGKMMPGLSRGIDVRGVETDYLKDSVTTGGATMMMALNTFNRAMGWLHLGMDEYRTPRDMLTSFITKRVLPVGGLIAGMDALDNFVDNSGLFEGTPLGEGLYQVPMNVYAGVRLASAGVLDAAGVTSIAKYTEDLLPGSVNSPLSGAIRGIAPFMAGAGLGYHMGGMKGGMTGGLIGGAVGIMLGGGPLGLFDCLPGSELVKTAEGFKPIEVIQEGDMVFTGNGRLRRVTKKWEREPKELIQLDICGVPLQPRASDNHAILTKNQEEVRVWKTLGSVKEGDFLAFPASRSRVRGNIDLLWYLDTLRHPVIVEGESSKRKVYALMEVGSKSTRGFGVQVTSTGIYKQPVDLQWNSYLWPNAKLGRFIGWYLAEGSPMRNPHPTGMGLAINVPKESDYVINTVIEEVRPYLPLGEVSISYDNKQIQISGSHAADIIHNLCHSPYSKEKAIHPDLMEIQSDAFYAGLLGGYIDGDGHIRKNSNGNITNVGIDTTSIDLAWDIWRILLQFGIISSVRRHPNYLNGERKKDKIKILISSRKYVKKLYELCKDHSYKIGSCLEPIELSKEKASNTDNYFYLEDNYAFFRIRNISRIPSNELRYDLEVDEDSSFLGFGITYHNSWDISKSRAEIVQEFKGEKETAIKKGRFWELSSGNFWGNQLSYFRPHLYHLMRSDYKDSPNYKTSMFDEIASYIDPSVYSRKHYFSRPSLEHPGLLSNIPIIGPAINLGNTEAHREDVDLTQLARDREEIRAVYAGGSGSPGEALAMASGTGPSEYLTNNFYPDPRSNSSINSRLSDTFYNFKEVAGLRGFLAETFQESLTGNKQLFADQPTIEANSIGSMGRQFWDLNLGGIAGLSEGIRRIFPRKTADIEYFNPVRNCLLPDSMIRVNGAYSIPIEELRINQLVFNNTGFVPVGEVFTRHAEEDAFQIFLNHNFPSLSVTGEHPIWSIKTEYCHNHSERKTICYSERLQTICNVCGYNDFNEKRYNTHRHYLDYRADWIPAKDLKVGDFIGLPIIFSSETLLSLDIFSTLEQYLVSYRGGKTKQAYIADESSIWTRRGCKPIEARKIPREILLTYEFGYICGLWLSEGCDTSNSNSIKFSLSCTEEETLAKELIEYFSKFGIGHGIERDGGGISVIIYSSVFLNLFKKLFGSGAENKFINEKLLREAPIDFLNGIFHGMFEGDGSIRGHGNTIKTSSKSRNLILSLRDILLQSHIVSGIHQTKTGQFVLTIYTKYQRSLLSILKDTYGYKIRSRKEFKIGDVINNTTSVPHFFKDNFLYMTITKLNQFQYKGLVYDIHVPSGNSFCTEYALVHNSMPNWMPGSEFYVDYHHGDPFSKIEMGEARLPGESYETIRSIAPVTPGEADLLGTTAEEAMGYYSGDIETIIPRYKWNDKIEQRKKLLIDSLKAQGSLIREQGIVYDTSKNITAYADATYRNDDGEIVPVKFAPYLGKEGGFLAGSASSLNAYLTLSGTRKGLLIGIDETGNTTQAIIFRDPERYEREAESDLQIRMRSYQELAKRRARGEPTAPGIHYSHMDRLKILSDVAYYSNQYKNELKIVKTQIKTGVLGEQEALEVEEIENKVEKLKQKFLFIEDRFGGGEALTPEAQRRRDEVDSRYNAVERTIGKLWQDVTTMRNPLISKLIGNRTALQAYQEDVVYGRAFKEWSSPIESYVKPFYQQMAVSSNPAQGALSGATAGFLMGGPLGAAVGGFGGTLWSLTGAQMIDKGSYIPGDVKKQREIMAAADIAERDRYQMLYEQTGYNEYLYRMRNTIAGAIEINQPMTSGRMIAVSNKPERMYMKGILDDLNTENLQEARALLPQNIAALLDRNVGIRGDVRPEDYTGGYFVEPGDVANTQVPIEDVVVKTMQLEGLNAKDVGLGWQRTLRRMNTMKEIGIEAPAMYQRNLPKRKIEYTIAPAQIKKVLDGILREYNPSITVHSGDGPLEVVVEIV